MLTLPAMAIYFWRSECGLSDISDRSDRRNKLELQWGLQSLATATHPSP